MRPLIRIDGWDGSDVQTAVRSRTRPDLWHDQLVRLDNGNVSCLCEWATYQKLTGNLYKETPRCWHQAVVIRRLRELADRKFPTIQDLAAFVDYRFRRAISSLTSSKVQRVEA